MDVEAGAVRGRVARHCLRYAALQGFPHIIQAGNHFLPSILCHPGPLQTEGSVATSFAMALRENIQRHQRELLLAQLHQFLEKLIRPEMWTCVLRGSNHQFCRQPPRRLSLPASHSAALSTWPALPPLLLLQLLVLEELVVRSSGGRTGTAGGTKIWLCLSRL